MTLLGTTTRNFLRHDDTDLAAGLTYYAVLALFPAALALLSLLALIGTPDDAVKTVTDILEPLMSANRLDDIEPTIRKLAEAEGATWTFALGVVGALYSASAYVGGFSRAMNTVREVEETRPFWKLRPLMFFITLVLIVLNVVALVIITATGPIATSVGDKLGIGRSVLDVWDVAKWPGLALVVVIVVAILFNATPNVKTGRFRVLTPGAFVALLIWAAASTGFAFFVANFGSYNKTYGSLAGGVIALLWLWLTNVALLFGAELDAARDAREAAKPPPPPPEMLQHAAAAHPPVAAKPAVVESAETDDVDLEALMPPTPPTGTRRRDKVVVAESFPRKPNQPPYGPVTQPVPQED